MSAYFTRLAQRSGLGARHAAASQARPTQGTAPAISIEDTQVDAAPSRSAPAAPTAEAIEPARSVSPPVVAADSANGASRPPARTRRPPAGDPSRAAAPAATRERSAARRDLQRGEISPRAAETPVRNGGSEAQPLAIAAPTHGAERAFAATAPARAPTPDRRAASAGEPAAQTRTRPSAPSPSIEAQNVEVRIGAVRLEIHAPEAAAPAAAAVPAPSQRAATTRFTLRRHYLRG